MNQAAVFLAGSILTMLGFVVVVAGVWSFESYPPSIMLQQKDDNKTT